MSKSLNIKKQIAREKAKCKIDPVYFIKNHCIIQHPLRGKIKFELFDFQEDLIQQLEDNRYNICLKARQLGISTLSAAYALWKMVFQDDFNILVLATKQSVAKNLVTKVRVMNDFLPSYLQLDCIENNKLNLRFSNGSQIKAVSSTPDSARSEALSLLILDEAAFIPKAEEVWTSAQATLSTGGKVFLLSTPNGSSGLFFRLWQDALAGLNDFNTIKLKWDVHPERTQEYRDEQTKILGAEAAAQECFDGSTRVLTDKGYKPIKDINIGDNVLTHKNRFKKVVRLYTKNTDDYIKIKTSNNLISRYVTKNHPILFNDDWIEVGSVTDKSAVKPIPKIPLKSKKVTSLDVYDLTSPKYFKKVIEGDLFYINDRKHKVRHYKNIDLDYDLGWFIGFYLAEGNKNRVSTYFSSHTKERDYVFDKLSKIVGKLSPFIKVHYRFKRGKTVEHSIHSEVVSQIISYFVSGNRAYNKKLTTKAYEKLNEDFSKGILEGYLFGDGNLINSNYNKSCSSTSLDLLYDIKYLLESFNKNDITLGHCKKASKSIIEGRLVNNRDSFRIGFKKTKNNPYEGVKSFNKTESQKLYKEELPDKKPIQVYNLEVEDDHTYITEHLIVHNCDCDFLTSGNSVISGKLIKWYEDNYCKEPIQKRGVGEDLWIWEFPQYDKDYVVSVDVSRGDGSDYSAFHVIDIKNIKQVAEFKAKVSTRELARMLFSIGIEYNKALVVVENANVGWDVVNTLIEDNYPNLFYTYKNDPFFDKAIQLRKRYDMVDKKDCVPGFSTTTKTRPVIISKIETYFREKTIEIYSKRTISELYTFIWKDGKAGADEGHNDDLVMSLAIGLWIRDTALRMKQVGIDMTKKTISSFSKGVYKSSDSNRGDGYWKYKAPDGSTIDLTDLLG